MPFTELTFGFEEILTSSKMNTMDANVDEVRRSHKGSSAPPAPTAGTLWLNDAADPWVWSMYDGTSWITLGTISPADNMFIPFGAGPRFLNSFSAGGSGDNVQNSALLGARAFRITGRNISTNNSTSNLRLRWYNNGGAISQDSYRYGRTTGNAGRDTAMLLSSALGGSSRDWNGIIDCYDINGNGYWHAEWSFNRDDGVLEAGHGYYRVALTQVTGAQLSVDDGSFDEGTWYLYQMPDWA